MTAEPGDLLESRMLKVVADTLDDAGHGLRRPAVVRRRSTARSQLYFLGECGGPPEFVVKAPLADAQSEHPPLDAGAQFAALRRSHGWFRREPRHGVAEPLVVLPDFGVLVMHYAPGPTVADVFARSPRQRQAAVDAAGAAGEFLRRFHAHAEVGAAEVRIADLAAEIRNDAREILSPLGRSLPGAVCKALERSPDARIPARRVLRHGDYVGANLIVAGERRLTMLDPALSEVGLPEDDVCRFLAHLASTTVFMGGVVWRPYRRLRLSLEAEFLAAYGELPNPRPIFELRLLRQYVLRWARRVEAAKAGASGLILAAQEGVIDTHMRGLLAEGAARLTRSWAAAPRRGCCSVEAVA